MKEMAILKFNSGNLAILCSKCYKIIKVGYEFNEKEKLFYKGQIDLEPYYCDECTELENEDKI